MANRYEFVKALLESGASKGVIDDANKAGKTALSFAKTVDMTKLLIAHGATK